MNYNEVRSTFTLTLWLSKWRCLRTEKELKNLAIPWHCASDPCHPLKASENFARRGMFFKQIAFILPVKSKDFSLGALISMMPLEKSNICSANCSSNGHPEINLPSNSGETSTQHSFMLINISNPLKDGGGSILQSSRVRCLNCKQLKNEEGNFDRQQ